jgi:predicted GH43/DUF377 family glycosyl hydrolase
MEPGPSPFVTTAGILLIYNGADDNLVYGPGWALFDKAHPNKLLARSDHSFVRPQLPWEKAGTVPNVIFVEGLEGSYGDAKVYYGAADRYIGLLHFSAVLNAGR